MLFCVWISSSTAAITSYSCWFFNNHFLLNIISKIKIKIIKIHMNSSLTTKIYFIFYIYTNDMYKERWRKNWVEPSPQWYVKKIMIIFFYTHILHTHIYKCLTQKKNIIRKKNVSFNKPTKKFHQKKKRKKLFSGQQCC